MRLVQHLAVVAALVACAAACAPAGAQQVEGQRYDSPLPAQYRHFKMYTTSAPAEGDANRIEVTARLLNEGEKPLDVRASLEASEELGFAGGEFAETIPPDGEAQWRFALVPAEGFDGETLRGRIAFGDRVDRELYIRVLPADPADFDDQRVEKITEQARVVATYVPRTRESIQRSLREREEAEAARPKLTIAKDGQSDYRIVLSLLPEGEAFETWAADAARTEPEKEVIQAVRDLQRVIEVKSGATLAIGPAPGAPAGPAIRLETQATASGPGALRWLPQTADDYVLRTDDADVRVYGNGIDGLRNGIYGLISDHLDAHWFQPRRLGEEIVVPDDRTVTLPADLDETHTPDWFSVNGMSWGNSRDWDIRNRSFINRGRMTFGHAWQGYINPQEYPYEEHPDLWARDREGNILKKDEGWTWTNFCSTSPQAIEIVATNVNALFDANPDAIVASLDPNDYAPMCLCDRCLALDKQYGQTREDGKEVADRLIHFSNEIHQRLKPEHKDKYLGILIYGYQMELPISAKPHEHHAGLICNFPTRYDATRPFTDPTSEKARDFHRLVKGWGDILSQMGYYDYPGHWYYFGPWGMIHKLREEFPAIHDLGGTFLIIEAQPNFGIQGPNLYIAAQLAWDKDADVDLLFEEFVTKYYGPAADAMRDFWLANERRYALTRPGTHAERAADDPEFWSELEGHLKRAEEAVAGEGVDKRFKDRVLFNREGFDYGREHYALRRHVPRRGEPVDRAAARAAVEQIRPRIERVRTQYAGDDYWPTLLAAYFYPDVDALLKRLEEGGPTPEIE